MGDTALSRRRLLGLAGGVALGGGAGAVGGWTARGSEADAATPVDQAAVPFHGPHQAGIATPMQASALFLAFDLVPDADRDAVRDLLRLWTDLARAATAGQGAADDVSAELVAGPARSTVTFGLGAGLFAQLGLDDQRPPGVGRLPGFNGDQIEERWSDGDLLLQIGADDSVVVSHVAGLMTRAGAEVVRPRWSMRGFARAAGVANPAATQRNLMGQLDGSRNPVPGSADFDRAVWVSENGPAWLHGGSTLVIRRIRMDLDAWSRLDRHEQERVIGRRKDNGAPLGGREEFDPPDFGAQRPDGGLAIPANSHIRLSAPESNRGATIFRRSFSYDDGVDGSGARDAGLIFCSWQADITRGFLPIQARIAVGDRLNDFTTPVGSATFAVPPGCGPDGYVGETLI